MEKCTRFWEGLCPLVREENMQVIRKIKSTHGIQTWIRGAESGVVDGILLRFMCKSEILRFYAWQGILSTFICRSIKSRYYYDLAYFAQFYMVNLTHC